MNRAAQQLRMCTLSPGVSEMFSQRMNENHVTGNCEENRHVEFNLVGHFDLDAARCITRVATQSQLGIRTYRRTGTSCRDSAGAGVDGTYLMHQAMMKLLRSQGAQ
jgi:hypothetical protein